MEAVEVVETSELTTDEKKKLDGLEQIIKNNLAGFKMAGLALTEIRDSRLYRETHRTFESYVIQRWDMSRSHAYRYIAAAEVAKNLSPIGDAAKHLTESQAREMATLDPDMQVAAYDAALTLAGKKGITAEILRDVATKIGAREVLASSASNGWFTPAEYLEAARAVMGSIDLDPASCAEANKTVGATQYFTEDQDGLSQSWFGNVWLNPPYGMSKDHESNQGVWLRSLIARYQSKQINQAVFLCNAQTGDQWFQPLWDFPLCFVSRRIKFIGGGINGMQPTHGSVLAYFGHAVEQFADRFSAFGPVVIESVRGAL